jgi:two-component system, cell cycle response regulator
MRILVADDDFRCRHIVDEALKRWGYEVETVADGKEALRVLQGNDPPRIAILDWMMQGMDGIEVCRQVRKCTRNPCIYIIVTLKSRMGDVSACLQSGADDCLIKPLNLQELQARVQAGQRVVDMQAAKQQSLRYSETHDLLTGLWNRAGILEIAGKEMAYAEREGKSLCLALVNIDNFKILNDQFGHAAVECILPKVAQKIRSVMRSYDDIGRYGDEEFLVIITGLDEQYVFKQAQRLQRHIGERPFNVLGKKISITISIGVAIKPIANGARNVQSLIHAANEAICLAKSLERKRTEKSGSENVYTELLILTGQHRKSMEL